MKTLSNFFAKPNLGLLILRGFLGLMMVIHGMPKLLGNASLLTEIGQKMSVIGISFAPLFWGFCIALVETLGGLFLILGFFFRPAAFLLFLHLAIQAYYFHTTKANFLNVTAYPLELAIVFLGLLFIGPGKISVDKQ